jgi:hypothetical protein
MAWPTAWTAADYLSREGADTESSVTILQALYDRDIEIGHKRTTWYGGQSNMTTTLADTHTADIRFPDNALQNTEVKLIFQAQRDGGVSGNASFRLRETGVPTNGTTLTTALTTSWAGYEVVGLTVPDDTWAGTVKTLALQAQRPASGADSNWRVTLILCCLNLAFEAP